MSSFTRCASSSSADDRLSGRLDQRHPQREQLALCRGRRHAAARAILRPSKGGPCRAHREDRLPGAEGRSACADSLATWNYTQTSADRCGGPQPGLRRRAASTFPSARPDCRRRQQRPGARRPLTSSPARSSMYGGTITRPRCQPTTRRIQATRTPTWSSYSVPDLANAAKVVLLFGGHIAPSTGPRGWGVGVGAGRSRRPVPHRITRPTARPSAVATTRSCPARSWRGLVIEKVAVGGNATFNYTSTGGLAAPRSRSRPRAARRPEIVHEHRRTARTVTSRRLLRLGLHEPPVRRRGRKLERQRHDVEHRPRRGRDRDVHLRYCASSIVVDKVRRPRAIRRASRSRSREVDSINQGFSLTDAAAPHNSVSSSPAPTPRPRRGVPAGWDLTSATCSDGSSPGSISRCPGETVTCTFTNTKRATLVVYKQVVNDNGGSAVSSNWTMNVSGPTNLASRAARPGRPTRCSPARTPSASRVARAVALSYPTSGLPAASPSRRLQRAGAAPWSR